jgi:hypothetical protein
MSRLNNFNRDAIVASVMADVPKTDYAEAARKMIQQYCVDHLPDGLKTAHEKHKEWLNKCTLWNLPSGVGQVSVVGPDGDTMMAMLQKDSILWDALIELGVKQSQQEKTRRELRDKLRTALNSCTTFNMARERLPEFAKYIPEDKKESANLPVINIAKDFMAAGWPASMA